VWDDPWVGRLKFWRICLEIITPKYSVHRDENGKNYVYNGLLIHHFSIKFSSMLCVCVLWFSFIFNEKIRHDFDMCLSSKNLKTNNDAIKVNRGGLNGVVVSIADCYPKGAGLDSRVMLGIFPLRKRGLRTLVWQTDLGKEANLSRNPEREGPNFTRLLRQYLLL
jgi:hypothetical protein